MGIAKLIRWLVQFSFLEHRCWGLRVAEPNFVEVGLVRNPAPRIERMEHESSPQRTTPCQRRGRPQFALNVCTLCQRSAVVQSEATPSVSLCTGGPDQFESSSDLSWTGPVLT